MKRKLAIMLAGVMLLSGCASGGSAENPVGDTVKADDGQVDITVMCAYASEDPHGQYVYKYAENFMKDHPGVNVEIQAISSNDIYTKLAAMVTSPDDLPTLFFTNVDQAPMLYDLGLLEDLNAHMDKEDQSMFADGIVDACTLDGMFAFYPVDVQPMAVIYRTDRFEEENLAVPTDWEEFAECAKALTKDSDGDGEVDQWGFSMVGSNNSSGQSRFMAYLWSTGCNLVSYDESSDKWVMDLGDDFEESFKFWTDMNNVYGVVPTGITEVDYATAANYFAMGYTNMMLTGSNAIGVAYDSNPELKGKIGSFPIPGVQPGTMLNTEGYALCSYASDEQKAAALDFLKYFSTNDSEQMFWQSSGKIPVTLEAQNAEYITGDDYKGYLETIQNGCLDPVNFGGLNGVKSLLGDAYSAVFSGEKSNEEAIETFKTGMDELLEDYN